MNRPVRIRQVKSASRVSDSCRPRGSGNARPPASHDNARTSHRGHRDHRGGKRTTFSVSSVISVAYVALWCSDQCLAPSVPRQPSPAGLRDRRSVARGGLRRELSPPLDPESANDEELLRLRATPVLAPLQRCPAYLPRPYVHSPLGRHTSRSSTTPLHPSTSGLPRHLDDAFDHRPYCISLVVSIDP